MQTVILLTALFTLASARERWVWGQQQQQQQQQQRSGRQVDPLVSQASGGFSLQSSAASLSPLSRPGSSESSFSVPETGELGGSLSQSQPPLVIRPLPIDISTLPLETQDSRDSFDPLDGLLSPTSRQRPQQDLSASPNQQVPVIDLSRSQLSNHHLPLINRAQQPGHLKALVSTPDISKLPLQSETDPSSSSSFSPSTPLSSSSFNPSFSSYSFVSPFAPNNDVPEGNRAVLFPQKIDVTSGRLPSQSSENTPHPPSITPLPTRVFLPPLDDTDILRGNNKVFKTLEALQKEALTQNPEQFDLTFQSLNEQLNDIQEDESGNVIFPVLSRTSSFAVKNPAGSRFPAKSPLFSLPFPFLHPGLRQQNPSFLANQGLKPLKRTPREGFKLERSDDELDTSRSSSYVWVWPQDSRDTASFVN